MTVNPGAAHPPVRLRFTPLDGVGTRNNFRANAAGAAAIAVGVPTPFTHANAILLTYHSDGRNHGAKRGALGVVAHHQLIMRFP